ncbi:MAG: hypothetical protein PHN78_04190 [Dehalococcoidales bacterium]|nr:hypothetical protein [Dehalococcoidales bacterium]
MADKPTRLTRPIHPVPEFASSALNQRGLMGAYLSRPPYQRNDYIGWINRAMQRLQFPFHLIASWKKRIHQSLDLRL